MSAVTRSRARGAVASAARPPRGPTASSASGGVALIGRPPTDEGAKALNRRRALALVAGIVGAGGAVGAALGALLGRPVFGLLVGLVFVGAWTGVASAFGDRLLLAAAGARPVVSAEAPRLHNLLDGLAAAAGIPVPRAFVLPEGAPNAFSVGRGPERAAVAVTEGLLTRLNRIELEAVLAHELVHIRDGDVGPATLAAALALPARPAADRRWGPARGRARARAAGWVLAPLLAAVALAIRLAVPVERELRADAAAALLVRYPPGLSAALRRVAAPGPVLERASAATALLWFAPPELGTGRLARWLRAHPPLAERLRLLAEM
jgi:heat shock protein HtpX